MNLKQQQCFAKGNEYLILFFRADLIKNLPSPVSLKYNNKKDIHGKKYDKTEISEKKQKRKKTSDNSGATELRHKNCFSTLLSISFL